MRQVKYETTTTEISALQHAIFVELESDNVLFSDVTIDFNRTKEGKEIAVWVPSETQQTVLAYLHNDSPFTASEIRSKLLKLDGNKFRQESKLIDNRFIIGVCKKAEIFGLADFSAKISKSGNLSFKFSDFTGTIPFTVTLRSPEEREEARLLALKKRVANAYDKPKEKKIVEEAITEAKTEAEEKILSAETEKQELSA